MKLTQANLAHECHFAKSLHRDLPANALSALKQLVQETGLSFRNGDIIYLNGAWFVRHAGLLRVARRRRCLAIHTLLVLRSSDPSKSRWVFKATVFKSPTCVGFTGYGDADPSNVSLLVRGAEMRVAETRAVNRALRKAYGIGICSVEEIGSSAESRHVRRMPPQSASGNGNYGGPKVRDRLCQLIRQHGLDAGLVKSYAVDFCGIETLREATREQVEAFVAHLSDWAQKDRNALLCQLNSYLPAQGEAGKAGAA
jgi:hypothetical protein